jgi:hypothetical protein
MRAVSKRVRGSGVESEKRRHLPPGQAAAKLPLSPRSGGLEPAQPSVGPAPLSPQLNESHALPGGVEGRLPALLSTLGQPPGPEAG